MENNYHLNQIAEHHRRKTYDIMNLVSDIGGVYEFFIMIIGILMFTISEHSFTLATIKKLFFVKNSKNEHKDLFKHGKFIDK